MKYIILISLLISSFVAKAENIQMADAMRSEGKIYVVVAVLCIILVGLFTYLITIDRKVSKLEKEVNS
ncbi:MAG: CcmD family protein [Vicingaceae bacterium]|jgi:CcmD family protein